MTYGFTMFRIDVRWFLAGRPPYWPDAPKVKDHFLRACFDAELDPKTTATLFRLLVKYEEVAE